MHLFVNVVVIWLSLSVFVVATGWYVATLIKEYWPDWWRRVVVDTEPGVSRK